MRAGATSCFARGDRHTAPGVGLRGRGADARGRALGAVVHLRRDLVELRVADDLLFRAWLRRCFGQPFHGDQHPNQLLLTTKGIELRTARVQTSRTKGFVERMNHTLVDKCYLVQGQTIWHIELEKIQRGLDRFIDCHIVQRSHQGFRLAGRPRKRDAKRWESRNFQR